MKKEEVLKSKKIKIRKVNKNDRANASNKYQKESNYIITTSNGIQFYSKNGSLKDALGCENYAVKNFPGKKITVTKKAPSKTVKTSQKKDRVVRNYVERDNNKVRIVKAPNGKYFTEYTNSGAGAGPFKTIKEAETMLRKHRPTAKRVPANQTRKNSTIK